MSLFWRHIEAQMKLKWWLKKEFHKQKKTWTPGYFYCYPPLAVCGIFRFWKWVCLILSPCISFPQKSKEKWKGRYKGLAGLGGGGVNQGFVMRSYPPLWSRGDHPPKQWRRQKWRFFLKKWSAGPKILTPKVDPKVPLWTLAGQKKNVKIAKNFLQVIKATLWRATLAVEESQGLLSSAMYSDTLGAFMVGFGGPWETAMQPVSTIFK